MDAGEVRGLLVGVRKKLDEAASKIVNDAKELDAEIDERAGSQHRKFQEDFEARVGRLTDELRSAFEQWEITESIPLNENDSFMYALRGLMAEIDAFRPERQGAR